MKTVTQRYLNDSANIKLAMSADNKLLEQISSIARECRQRLAKGGTVYTCGNGGSTCDAMHFSEELVARYKRERAGLRSMHFMDASTITCWSNDYSYETAFARSAETFCTPSDILFGFSTSGNSKNVLNAMAAAKKKGAFTVALTGKDGGELKSASHICIIVPSNETDRIQESHITIVHILCELIESEPL